MKKKSLVLISSVMLVALLIAGGTMAWFTAEADPVENNFTAGTVVLELNENNNYAPIENWNPGDTTEKPTNFVYKGTKKALVRAKVSMVWLDEEGKRTNLSTDNVTLTHDKAWTSVQADGWLYYKYVFDINDPEYSTMDPENPELDAAALTQEVKFDGPSSGNEYQGKKLKITYEAQAVQASNGAYKDVWGITKLPVAITDLVAEKLVE